MTVTPDGHDLPVWAPTLTAAPRVSVSELVSALLPEAAGPVTLLVAGAHPDDETLGLGRLAHHWASHVGPVLGLVATAGEACVDHVIPRPPGLAELRIAEWHLALDRLGFGERWVLDLPDGRVADHEGEMAVGLAGVADRQRQVVLAAPWRHDPHPDHRAVGRAAARVAELIGAPLIEFGVWMTYWSEPASVQSTGQVLAVVITDPADDQARKAAVLAFGSQLEPLHPSIGPVLPPAMLAHQPEQVLILEPSRLPAASELVAGRA